MPDKDMSSGLFDETDFDEDFDPLMDDQDDVVEGSDSLRESEDIVEMPTILNMPENHQRSGVFDADKYASAKDALRALFEKNPGRRSVFLGILETCQEPCLMSAVAKTVDELQACNASVYSPATLCNALKRAGGLDIEIPEPPATTEQEDGSCNEIGEELDPIWTTTLAGREVLVEERNGRAVKELFAADSDYIDMYLKVLDFCNGQPRTKSELDELVDNDPTVQNPRRYSNHFIEYLEHADCLIWKDSHWTITALGKTTLKEA